MRILNLSFPDNSEIKYKISKFPDGQQDIVIDKNSIPTTLSGGAWVPICITSRFNSFLDLELIICTTKALRRLGVSEIHLYIPYLLGARSDRHFQEGGNSYLVDVVAPIINAQNFRSVMVMDVHSDVAAACINRLKSIDNKKLVDFFWKENGKGWGDYVFISPDGGALKKIYKLADSVGFKGDVITCSKSRDENGQLSRVLVPLNTREHSEKEFVIIDDICDGGRTFINIADNIKQNGYTKNKIHLIVTHGIFSAGFNQLARYFDSITFTNSYFDFERDEHLSEHLIFEEEYDKKINQLNIF